MTFNKYKLASLSKTVICPFYTILTLQSLKRMWIIYIFMQNQYAMSLGSGSNLVLFSKPEVPIVHDMPRVNFTAVEISPTKKENKAEEESVYLKRVRLQYLPCSTRGIRRNTPFVNASQSGDRGANPNLTLRQRTPR